MSREKKYLTKDPSHLAARRTVEPQHRSIVRRRDACTCRMPPISVTILSLPKRKFTGRLRPVNRMDVQHARHSLLVGPVLKRRRTTNTMAYTSERSSLDLLATFVSSRLQTYSLLVLRLTIDQFDNVAEESCPIEHVVYETVAILRPIRFVRFNDVCG